MRLGPDPRMGSAAPLRDGVADHAEWGYQPDLAKSSEVEVRFTPRSRRPTRVDLEHRHFERMGPGGEAMRLGRQRTWRMVQPAHAVRRKKPSFADHSWSALAAGLQYGRGVVCAETLEEFMTVLKKFVREEAGADLIEYALLAGFDCVCLRGAMSALSGSLNGFFTASSTKLDSIAP